MPLPLDDGDGDALPTHALFPYLLSGASIIATELNDERREALLTEARCCLFAMGYFRVVKRNVNFREPASIHAVALTLLFDAGLFVDAQAQPRVQAAAVALLRKKLHDPQRVPRWQSDVAQLREHIINASAATLTAFDVAWHAELAREAGKRLLRKKAPTRAKDVQPSISGASCAMRTRRASGMHSL